MAFTELSSPPFEQRQLRQTGDELGVPTTSVMHQPRKSTHDESLSIVQPTSG